MFLSGTLCYKPKVRVLVYADTVASQAKMGVNYGEHLYHMVNAFKYRISE